MKRNQYTRQRAVRATAASKRELLSIRLLIIFGLGFMGLFLWSYAKIRNVGYLPLYLLLTFSLAFQLLVMLHEWYHYWDVKRPAKPAAGRQWTVDILTTFCPGEPYEMIVETLKAIQDIRYPHTTYLCDEANDPYLKMVCEEMGIRHVTRTVKKDAKAGNINNALKQATGEICLILDPDHIPRADFLDVVLPYFEDPEIGFVQVVQAYYNRKESIVAYGAAEQTYHFYGPMMMSMGSYGTAQAIGANCTFRRAALDSIGGHAAGLSEDMHTAMQLHAKKWKSVYVPEPLSRGLVPGTLAAYYKQQIKWARGTFELLFVTYPKLFRHFTWRQKIHYFTVPLYYLFGLMGLIDIVIPVMSLLLMELPLKMDLVAFALSFAPLFFTSLLIRQYAQRWLIEKHEAGFHMIGGILRSGTWWIYLMGLVYTIFRVKVPYIPTPKNDQPKNNFLLCLPNILVCVLTLGSIAYGIHTYGRLIFLHPYYQMMVGFSLINVMIMGSNVLIGQEKFLRSVYTGIERMAINDTHIMPFRLLVWKSRYGFYRIIRNRAIFLFALVSLSLCSFITYQYYNSLVHPLPTALKYATTRAFYYGVDPPETANAQSGQAGKPVGEISEANLSIVPLHHSWDLKYPERFPTAQLQSITSHGAIPLIYWEPDADAQSGKGQGIMKTISQGKYDAYLRQAARQFQQFGKPLFLVFAPEPDNPVHSWSSARGNTMVAHQQAWRYVVTYFKRLGVNNVVWVWNPWKATTLESYYPGSDYVDWIGVNSLNYGNAAADGEWHSFKALYQPYKNKLKSHQDDSIRKKPIMLIKFGSTNWGGSAESWVQDAMINIREDYPEIRSLIFFLHHQDTTWQSTWHPSPSTRYIEWTFPDSTTLPQLLLANPPRSFQKREGE